MSNPNIPIDKRTNRVELIGLVLGVDSKGCEICSSQILKFSPQTPEISR